MATEKEKPAATRSAAGKKMIVTFGFLHFSMTEKDAQAMIGIASRSRLVDIDYHSSGFQDIDRDAVGIEIKSVSPSKIIKAMEVK